MTKMRPAIIKLHEKGLSIRKIANLLDVPFKTVHRHIGSEPDGLFGVEHPRSEGLRQASQERGVVEASASQGLGRDLGEDFGENR